MGRTPARTSASIRRHWARAVVILLLARLPVALAQVPTTLLDFFQPGSQPNGSVVYESFLNSSSCRACHELSTQGEPLDIHPRWQGSLMAQSARDPLFLACLAIANQDAAFSGDLCIRCHSPGGWISGRSEPTDGSALTANDRDGVSCSVCHRLVDPVFEPGISPAVDAGILANINPLPISPGGGNFILDPQDRRRGPFNDLVAAGHTWLHSPFHTTADLCATCHDVSNPVYERQADGTYAPTPLGAPHPTANKYDMFPIERTYSEWSMSQFAATGVDMNGRFGGNITLVSTCQDCHMPQVDGKGCNLPPAPFRHNLPAHDFSGGNAWVQDMVLNLYPAEGLNAAYLQAGKARSVSMLQRAGTLDVVQTGNHARVRIINETGHKLPSGYPEGRRMWINVVFRDAELNVLAEHGHYDALSAELSTADTKVYETSLGLDETMAELAGLTPGESFHFALNNVILKDNRIPPRGFSNAAFHEVQASPVGYSYVDGQYWDDTRFRIPISAASVTARVYYQTSSKEFITFLRDENHTNDAGQTLYDQWELTGKSPPVLMAEQTIALTDFPRGDTDGDDDVDLADLAQSVECLAGPGMPAAGEPCVEVDFDADADVDLLDVAEFQLHFAGL